MRPHENHLAEAAQKLASELDRDDKHRGQRCIHRWVRE
jgi:hypothetical protein